MRMIPTLGRTNFPRVRPRSPWSRHSSSCGLWAFVRDAPLSLPDGYENPEDEAINPEEEDSFSSGNVGSLWGWWPGKCASHCRAPAMQEQLLSSLFHSPVL